MTSPEDKKSALKDQGFTMQQIAEDLESVAAEDAAMKRGVARTYEALGNTVEAETPEGEKPMRMWVYDMDIGGRLPLLPETMMGLGGNISASIEQETGVLQEVVFEVAAQLVKEQGEVTDRLENGRPTQHKYVEDPATKRPIGIWVNYQKRHYSMRDREKLGKPAHEIVLNDVSFNTRTSREEEQGVMDGPSSVTITETGYRASFPLGNFRLDLNDSRNPRNWGPKRMGTYIRETLLSLVGEPAIKEDGRGNLAHTVSENETEQDRAYNIAHRAKTMVEESREAIEEATYWEKKYTAELQALLKKHADELGEYIKVDSDGEVDLGATIDTLDIYDREDLSAQENSRNRLELQKDPGSIVNKAKRLATEVKNLRGRISYSEEDIKRHINRVEERYDAGFI